MCGDECEASRERTTRRRKRKIDAAPHENSRNKGRFKIYKDKGGEDRKWGEASFNLTKSSVTLTLGGGLL